MKTCDLGYHLARPQTSAKRGIVVTYLRLQGVNMWVTWSPILPKLELGNISGSTSGSTNRFCELGSTGTHAINKRGSQLPPFRVDRGSRAHYARPVKASQVLRPERVKRWSVSRTSFWSWEGMGKPQVWRRTLQQMKPRPPNWPNSTENLHWLFRAGSGHFLDHIIMAWLRTMGCNYFYLYMILNYIMYIYIYYNANPYLDDEHYLLYHPVSNLVGWTFDGVEIFMSSSELLMFFPSGVVPSLVLENPRFIRWIFPWKACETSIYGEDLTINFPVPLAWWHR